MTGYEFIFSDKPLPRTFRHLLFWLTLLLHFIVQNLMTGGNVSEALISRSFFESCLNASFFFPIYIVSVYIFINRLLPLYFFRRRYITFFFCVAGFIIIDFIACCCSGALYLHFVLQAPSNKIDFNNDRYNAIVNGLFLPIVILGIACGIKLAKNWYLEQKENERLAMGKITKELQLLKNQLHPRFLFYSLHTVKKHISSHPLIAAKLILQLSDLLSYILYESDRKWAPLEKELEIIKSYIELQKKSTTGKLASEILVTGIIAEKYISPLMLLSIIENVFDFFLQENQKNASLQSYVEVLDTRLHYKLCCNHFSDIQPDASDVKNKFVNIEKQLLFIYPGTHQLEIVSNAESITIILNLPLHNVIISRSEAATIQNEVHALL